MFSTTKLYLAFNNFPQLNVNRAALRRKPVDITSINQPFNSEQFNFTKLKEGEILFQLKNEVDTTEYGNLK